ncbi:unnamed protein product, partial [Prorocentrum cordatum]
MSADAAFWEASFQGLCGHMLLEDGKALRKRMDAYRREGKPGLPAFALAAAGQGPPALEERHGPAAPPAEVVAGVGTPPLVAQPGEEATPGVAPEAPDAPAAAAAAAEAAPASASPPEAGPLEEPMPVQLEELTPRVVPLQEAAAAATAAAE